MLIVNYKKIMTDKKAFRFKYKGLKNSHEHFVQLVLRPVVVDFTFI